jgi:DNA repair exonuclease SbcCD ATPase subunit
MVLRARDEYNTAKKDYEVTYSKLDTLKNEVVFNTSQLLNYEEHKSNRLKELNQRLLQTNKDIASTQSKFQEISSDQILLVNKNIQKQEDLLRQINSSVNQHNRQADLILVEIESEKKQIAKLQGNQTTCPTCSRDYSTEHVSHINSLIQEHESIISSKTTELEKTNTKIKKLNDLKQETQDLLEKNKKEKRLFEEIQTDNNNLSLNLTHLTSIKNSIELDINSCQSQENNELKSKVHSLTEAVNELETKVADLNNLLNILDSVKFVISEEGIKSFLVKKILTVLNSRLAFYLKKLEANCLCSFNEFFDEEIIDENSNQKSYFNFSGGERKRIDLACLFAFADIRRLQGDVNFNTVFYDELLDSSLDDRGVALTLNVLRDRYNEHNESCYIITHRGIEVTSKSEHTIHVVKRNGISSVSC